MRNLFRRLRKRKSLIFLKLVLGEMGISRSLTVTEGKTIQGKSIGQAGVPFINAGCLQGKYLSEKHFNFIPVTRYKMLEMVYQER